MGSERCLRLICAVLLVCPLALSRHDDDFAFDNSEEFQVELTANHSEITKNGLRRLWGVPDTTAYVGHLFRMEIPKEAFSGDVLAYKVRSEDGRRMPSWLAVDSKHGLISGLPQKQDLGPHTFTVTAHGRTRGLTATDSFTVYVKRAEDKPMSKYGICPGTQKRLVLAILIEGSVARFAPRQKIRALMDLSNFMALDGSEFWVEPYKTESVQSHSVLMSGPGAGQRRRNDATTAIYLSVGCGDKLWARHKVLVSGVREQARDGTLTHILKLPVIGWRLIAVTPVPRLKRQLPLDDGSGAYDDNYDNEDGGDYSGYDDDEDDYSHIDVGPVPDLVDTPSETPKPPPLAPQTPPPSTTPQLLTPQTSHPHRHHHGEPPDYDTLTDLTPEIEPTTILTTKSTLTTTQTTTTQTITTTSNPVTTKATTVTPSPASVTPPPALTTLASLTPAPVTSGPQEETTEASTNTYTTEDHKVKITPYAESASESHVNYSKQPGVARTLSETENSPVVFVAGEDFTTLPTEPELQTVIIRASNEIPSVTSSQPPTPASPTTETSTSSTTQRVTQTIPRTTPLTPKIAETERTEAETKPTTVAMTTAQTVAVPVIPEVTYPTTTPTTVATTVSSVQTTTPTDEDVFIPEVTLKEDATSTERLTTIIGRTTETVSFAWPVNQPPTLKHHMKKLAITAGKAFRYIIPADLFTDPEENSNLTFTMYEAENVPLSNTSWIQFIPAKREVYGLPLESHVSRWNFIVEAQDSDGLSAKGPLDITVRQHKGARTVNHQFIINFKVVSKNFSNTIDWQIRALEGIVNLFRDTDMDHLTVLNATQNGDLYEFVWTNDTLPKDPACPMDDIKRLMKIMESPDEAGGPSAALARAMSPELQVWNVTWRGAGVCGTAAPPARAPDTYPPVTRNQVDHLTATVGQLLRYTVSEDTFFDPEDGDTRHLKLTLQYSDRSDILAANWLQFDSNNQEFYGLPLPGDEGQMHYQLIAEDSSKKRAYDSLIVEVVKAPTIRPTVEFQMQLEYPYTDLAYSSANKRKVVEKLAELFGQKTTDNIRVQSITDNPTTIVWYNTSLPMDRCPKKEIEELRRMIIDDERSSNGGALRENVDQIFDKDLKVMSIRLIPLHLCAEQNTKMKPAPPPIPGPGTNQQNKAGSASESGYTEYLITFVIPAVVIVCMILVAGIIACVLYRRRRTGKMSIGDEEERQAFRSKGIPVIFQDELEERTESEPVHKSPVIMREEKPPLLPPAPDYRGGEDAPYRPPPPFAASRSPPRPKATPTYRKPPPYVPP